jgi:hypothetical protein
MEMAGQVKQDQVEPEETFDMMLTKVNEKNGRNNAPPPILQAQFNQYSFLRAGRTLGLVCGAENKGNFSMREDEKEKPLESTAANTEIQAPSQSDPVTPACAVPQSQPVAETSSPRQPVEKEAAKDDYSISAELQEDN